MKKEMGVDKKGGVCFHEPYLDIFLKNSARERGLKGIFPLTVCLNEGGQRVEGRGGILFDEPVFMCFKSKRGLKQFIVYLTAPNTFFLILQIRGIYSSTPPPPPTPYFLSLRRNLYPFFFIIQSYYDFHMEIDQVLLNNYHVHVQNLIYVYFIYIIYQ